MDNFFFILGSISTFQHNGYHDINHDEGTERIKRGQKEKHLLTSRTQILPHLLPPQENLPCLRNQ